MEWLLYLVGFYSLAPLVRQCGDEFLISRCRREDMIIEINRRKP